ncbi:NarK/NasA family nitrate transporter [Asticcacaulis sp. BYS171W]|uniref:NarK/NasA family nitrate transporter n=1 Tax=Asticcacaulis aquaticus TaxID=2984212 RepID=A0ABT5HWM4_9CAUL|nr:nitrate/nitrite transporter [Asticcacaulis aquaticus]MDC7684438.1 NarK/NasA family nitrate transporter [Asticcacaulis aquaticus]
MQGQSSSEGLVKVSGAAQVRALSLTTIAFTISFAVWTIFAIVGVQIKKELGLSETQFSLLLGTPILTGSLVRLFMGIWADQYGGRPVMFLVMISSAICTWLLIYSKTYEMLLVTALGLGVAGGSFVVGISYLSKWYPKARQGTALGIYGMGNVGSAVTKICAPFVMVAFGWHAVAQIWAAALAIMAVLFFILTKDEPELIERRRTGAKAKSTARALSPLKKLQVWRFSVYYFFVFGGYVALALWLPRYYVGAYGLDIAHAGLLAASFSIAGSMFRAVGGYLSDTIGARKVMYITFIVCVICCFILSYPATDYVVHGIKGDIRFSISLGFWPFTVVVFCLGLFMSFGKAAVYKHIPVYYPENVGSVAGIVGLIGGLGGFFLPLAFGILNDLTNVWTSCFMLMFALVAIALTWMHLAIQRMEKARHPELRGPKFFPELDQAVGPKA